MKVKLGDICEIQAGGTPSRGCEEYWREGNIPWVKIGDFTGKYLTETEEKITELGLNNSSTKLFPAGTILYTIFATLGEVCILNINATTNQAICGLKIKANNIDINYLYYFLCSIKEAVIKIGRGVAQNNINLEILRNFEIEVCDLEKQRKIASVLDKLNGLIEKRKQQLENLDLLIKSKFIEMFRNGKFNTVKVSDVCEFITKGTTPSLGQIYTEYTDDRIPYLKVYNLSFTGELMFHQNPQYISKELHNLKLARSKVYPNDILMNIVGPPLGKFSIVTDDFEEWNINQAIAIFRAKNNILPKYLISALMQPSVLRPFINQAVGVRQLNISLEQCRNLEILLPTMDLQYEFVCYFEKIDKIKLIIKQSLAKLETLKKALMQKYFG